MRPIFTIATLATMVMVLLAPSSASATILNSGYHQILNRQDPRCLGVDGAVTWNGGEVRVAECENWMNQRWEYIPWYEPVYDASDWHPGPDGFKLRVEHTGKCLSVQWQPWYEGSNVVQDECKVAPYWRVSDLGRGWSRITTYKGERDWCLDKSWSDVTVWKCHDGWWQQWQSLG